MQLPMQIYMYMWMSVDLSHGQEARSGRDVFLVWKFPSKSQMAIESLSQAPDASYSRHMVAAYM